VRLAEEQKVEVLSYHLSSSWQPKVDDSQYRKCLPWCLYSVHDWIDWWEWV